MIDKQLLKEKLNSGILPIEEKFSKISLQHFSRNDFNFDIEQVIVIIKGRKEDFTDATEFFMQSLLYYSIYFDQQLDQNYLSGSFLDDFKIISLIDAKSIIEDCLSTLQKQINNFNWQGEFQKALLMSDDWNDKLLLIEFEQEYLIFQWFTTA